MYIQEVTPMPKDQVLNTRISATDLDVLKRAAVLAGKSTSAFVTEAALRDAEILLMSMDTTLMPAEQFAELVRTLDIPDPAPRLAQAFRDNRV
jgi:uncharacterized protein (DUF1778 family)